MISFIFKTAAFAALGAAVEEHARKHREASAVLESTAHSDVDNEKSWFRGKPAKHGKSTASRPLKVLHYNIYLGQEVVTNQDVKPTTEVFVAKLSKLKDWLEEQDADIVGLAECNRWDEVASVEEMTAALGYKFGVYKKGNAPKGAKKAAAGDLMVLSKEPIETVFKHTEWNENVEKCLHVKTFGIHVFQTHLSSKGAAMRFREVSAISPDLQRLTIAGEPLIMMGDMNSIVPSSTLAATWNEPQVLAQMKKAREGKPIFKNCIDGENKKLRLHGHDWKLDFRALDMVEELLTEVQPFAESGKDYTYPTQYRNEQKEDPKLRIDGVYVNSAMITKYPAQRSKILMEPILEGMSDHYPIITIFNPSTLKAGICN